MKSESFCRGRGKAERGFVGERRGGGKNNVKNGKNFFCDDNDVVIDGISFDFYQCYYFSLSLFFNNNGILLKDFLI